MMREVKSLIVPLLLLAGDTLFYYKMKTADGLQGKTKQVEDELVDMMSESSFPASDAPAY